MRKQQFQDVDKICNYLKSVETDQTNIKTVAMETNISITMELSEVEK